LRNDWGKGIEMKQNKASVTAIMLMIKLSREITYQLLADVL
jgi:hypothetical protein